MSEFLVIRLGSATGEFASWVVADETGAVLAAPESGELAAAAALAAGRQVIGLLPATEVLRTTADVPVKGASKMLQALPFALEDQLADDVEILHFAAGPRAADGRIGIAVVRRETMDAWVACIAAAGLSPERLYAESDGIAGVPNTTTLLLEEQCAVLAHPDGSAEAIDADNVETLLDVWLSSAPLAGDEEEPPRHLVVYCSPACAAQYAALWERVQPRVSSLDVHSLAEGALSRLAAQIVTTPGINLLQGSYAHRASLMAYWPAWRLAASLLLACGGLFLASQAFELVQLRRQSTALDKTIAQAFSYTFPGAGPPTDPRAELASRLRSLGGSADAAKARGFLDTLQVVSRSVAAAGSGRVEALNYRGGVMELRIRAPNVDTLDRIQRQVGQNTGLRAEIQSANAAGDEIEGRLQIKRTGG